MAISLQEQHRPILAATINQYRSILLGLKFEPIAIKHNLSGQTALSVQNTNAGGTHLDVLSSGSVSQLKVTDGLVRIGAGAVLQFADGSQQTTAGVGSTPNAVVANADATIQADADANGAGDIVFKTSTAVVGRFTTTAVGAGFWKFGAYTGPATVSAGFFSDIAVSNTQAYCSTDAGALTSWKVPLLSIDAGNITRVGPTVALTGAAPSGALDFYVTNNTVALRAWRIDRTGNLVYGAEGILDVVGQVNISRGTGHPSSVYLASGGKTWIMTVQDDHGSYPAALRLETTQTNPFVIVTGSVTRFGINTLGYVGVGPLPLADISAPLHISAVGVAALRIDGLTAGSVASPGTVGGYIAVNLGGTVKWVPYYN